VLDRPAGALLDDIRRRLGDRYEIVRELGRGGMGAVLLARDRALDRPVALKVLPPEFAAQADLRERFLRETRLAAGFSHPNIVPVFAVEDRDDLLAFAMGFVEGESLSDRVHRAGPLTAREAVRLLQDVSYALSYAHGRGVVHRDIKPDNIMLERATGRALVMDFGIARSITPAANASGLTRVGEVVGTPEYMSPEQASGDVVDGRSDLYSLGLVAIFALSGRSVFRSETVQQMMVRQLTEPAPPLASLRPDVPASLAAIIDDCVRKEPSARPASAEALIEALEVARVGGSEVPVAVRLLAADLAATGPILVFAAILLSYGVQVVMATQNGNLFSLGLLLGAVGLGRLLQTSQEIRGLRRLGYSTSELHRLLLATLDERQEQRDSRRADPVWQARRRRGIRVLVPLALAGVASAVLVVRRAPRVDTSVKLDGVEWALFLGGILLAAVSVILLIRSPFRPSVAERVFRLFWLGIPGRLFFRVAGLGLAAEPLTGVQSVSGPVERTVAVGAASRPVPPAFVGPSADEARFARIEARLDALEGGHR
jgi:hypothetical protein